MKIRKSFVSNSSSCSFVITKDDFSLKEDQREQIYNVVKKFIKSWVKEQIKDDLIEGNKIASSYTDDKIKKNLFVDKLENAIKDKVIDFPYWFRGMDLDFPESKYVIYDIEDNYIPYEVKEQIVEYFDKQGRYVDGVFHMG